MRGASHDAARAAADARVARALRPGAARTALLKPSRCAPSVAKNALSSVGLRARIRPWNVLPPRSLAFATVVHEPPALRRWIAIDWPSRAGAKVPLKRTLLV